MIKDIIEANESIQPNSKEMAVLRANFPSCFTADGSFDIERFKEFLSDKVAITSEGYELKFLGKNYARLLASLDSTCVIVPDEEHNSKEENKNSQNIYISGDNLDGLKHLLKSYAHSIKCIYIDPPYNTGSDGFVYNDSFSFTAEELSTKLSIDEEQAQHILDLTTRGSASHSAWLMFMYPRLLLARDLLTDDGVIFISIDDNEACNLKLICDDVFGEENFIGQITAVTNPGGRDYGGIARMHDYILAYTKNNSTELNLIETENSEFSMFDDNGGFELRELRNRNVKFNKSNRPNLYYPFYIDPVDADENGLHTISLEPVAGWIELYPLESQGINVVWRWGKIKSQKYLNIDLKAKPMKNGSYMIVQKYRESRAMARSVWWDKDINTQKGTLLIKELFNAKVFDYPKPLDMICKLIEMGINIDNDDIVLDFFSGSSTTAHALLQSNVKFNSNCKYIMIQLPETVQTGSEAEKAGYKTIDQIGMERIIRASAKIRQENPDTTADLGFKHYTLEEAPKETLDKLEDFNPDPQAMFLNNNILDCFGKETVLTTWLVRDGYGFNPKVKREDFEKDFAGYTGYYIDKHLYLIDAGLTKDAVMAIVEVFETNKNFNPINIVLFGYSFVWTEMEALKVNLQKLKDTEKNMHINFDIRY